MSAALERRYRAALRWYPRAWRRENADAIVGTMLDQADAEARSVPLRGELRDLASSGVSARFERVAPQAVRDRVAAISLAIGTAYALIMFVGSEWAPFATTGPLNGWMYPEGGPIYRAYSTVGFGPFASVMVLEYGLWVLAFVLVMLKCSRSAIAVLLLTVPLLVIVHSLRPDDIGRLQPQAFALVIVALLAVLASIGRPARLNRRVVVVLAAGAAATAIAFLVASHASFEGRLSPYSTLGVLNAPILGGLLLISFFVLLLRRQRAWAVAALVAASPWLALAVLYFMPLVIGFPLGAVVGFPLGAVVGGVCLAIAAYVWRSRGSRMTVANG